MMPRQEGVVRPVATARSPQLGPLAIIAATGSDLQILRRNLNLSDERRLYLSTLHYDSTDLTSPALVGPVMGAACAVMVLETLRAWGVHTIVFLGWCGSIDSRLRTGDLLLPDSAIVDEGTSPHYGRETGATVHPHGKLCGELSQSLKKSKIAHRRGRVWSTDGIFRETPAQINKFRNQGALAVEMELSALCSAADFYALSFAAVLVVSDELFTMEWQPGFKDKLFIRARTRVCHFLTEDLSEFEP